MIRNTSKMPSIRLAKSEDIDAMIQLLKQLFSIEKDFHFNQEKHREGLTLLLNKQNSLILIAEYNYLVVGMVTLQEHISTAAGGTIGIVEDMVIDENFRRKGIGKMLISSIESMAIHKGYKRIQLMADNNNVSAMKFYTKQNWSRTNLIAFFKFL